MLVIGVGGGLGIRMGRGCAGSVREDGGGKCLVGESERQIFGEEEIVGLSIGVSYLSRYFNCVFFLLFGWG